MLHVVRITCSASALEQGMGQIAAMNTQGRRELLALPAVNAASAHWGDTDAVISEEKERVVGHAHLPAVHAAAASLPQSRGHVLPQPLFIKSAAAETPSQAGLGLTQPRQTPLYSLAWAQLMHLPALTCSGDVWHLGPYLISLIRNRHSAQRPLPAMAAIAVRLNPVW